ncbi:MAG TPA: taurine dioxygenase, partial [Planctomycetaceae bacterium]|nr:taurine dioxygenase [Planctomycetaceae bacterium]
MNMSPRTQLEITRATPHCGARVAGVDLSQPLDGSMVDKLLRVLAEHCVLFFEDQRLTPVQQKTLGEHFGALHVHPAWP